MKSSELIGKRICIGQITFTSIKAFHMLKCDGIDIAMFFDKDYRMQHQEYNGTPIFPWSNFYDTYVILTTPSRYVELKKMLMEICGYSEDKILLLEDISFTCSESDVTDAYDWEWLARNTNHVSDAFLSYRLNLLQSSRDQSVDLVSPWLAVDVNNKCTLNCEYCYTQMPYYRAEERKNYDIEEVIAKLDELLDFIDYIPYLWILGGEPLLHPQLHKLISFLNSKKAQDKVVFADILTNGTLLLSNETIRAIKENPFFWRISVSPYGVHSKKQYELFTQLNKAGIPYYSRYMTYWQKFGQIVEPKSTDEAFIRRKCKNCICKNLHLANGKLYPCPVLVHFVALNRIPYDERNAFDLSKHYTKEDLRNFIHNYSPGMAYCNGNHQVRIKNNEMDEWCGEKVPVAEQAKGILPCKRIPRSI